MGEGSGKVFASGGDDGTVRLWSLNLNGKRGQHALRATLYGHGKPLVLMSVAGYGLVSWHLSVRSYPCLYMSCILMLQLVC